MTDPRPAPYPATVQAKGWRFELDPGQLDQSDTWALAAEHSMVQPCLLMMWLVAWQQRPCGSLPADEDVLRAKCRIPAELWAQHRGLFLRGWWLADDGRLYHPTLTARVREMLTKRRSDADRQALNRARQKPAPAPGVTPMSRVTPTGLPSDSGVNPALTTDNRESSSERKAERQARARVAADVPDLPPSVGGDPPPAPPAPPEPPPVDPTAAGAACLAMRERGKFSAVNPGDPRLLALLARGVSIETFVGVAAEAAAKRKTWGWLLTVVANRANEAAELATGPPAQASDDWTRREETVRLQAQRLGVPQRDDESIDAWIRRIKRHMLAGTAGQGEQP